MENQTTSHPYNEQITEAAKAFTAFGVPERIIMDGADITGEVVDKFGGVDPWLRRLVCAFNDFRITAFAIARVNGFA